MAALVMIVDDDRELVAALELELQQAGYSTCAASTGAAALRRVREEPLLDLILLELQLPDMDGLELCRQLHQDPSAHHVPIIIVTAKAEEIDRLVGLELGADDYVAKPFSMKELTLRVGAVLRRTQPHNTSVAEYQFGLLRVDTSVSRTWVGTRELRLSPIEYKLLLTLLRRRGRVQTRERLLEDVWSQSTAVNTRTVDSHMKRLRHKLGAAREWIETIRGVGYRFRDDPEPDTR